MEIATETSHRRKSMNCSGSEESPLHDEMENDERERGRIACADESNRDAEFQISICLFSTKTRVEWQQAHCSRPRDGCWRRSLPVRPVVS